MQELAGRLASLDPDAGAAVQVIAYFDRLIDSHAGLEALVRGAAVLSGRTAHLRDVTRTVDIRVETDGRRADSREAPSPGWPLLALDPSSGNAPAEAAVWLEQDQPAGAVEAMVLERLASSARVVLDRTRGRAVPHDPASVEVLLDPHSSLDARRRAARRLRLDAARPARAVAVRADQPVDASAMVDGHQALVVASVADLPQHADPGGGPVRIGVGPAAAVTDLAASWQAARTALRFTAAGTASDPGPRVVHADDLGALAVLALAIGADTPPSADVRALDGVASSWPWALQVLDAVTAHASLRSAARELTLHHSTLQERLHQLESGLGWSTQSPDGRLRLHLGLTLRRLHLNP